MGHKWKQFVALLFEAIALFVLWFADFGDASGIVIFAFIAVAIITMITIVFLVVRKNVRDSKEIE